MSFNPSPNKFSQVLSANWLTILMGLFLLAAVIFGVRWIDSSQKKPKSRKVMQIKTVTLQRHKEPAPTAIPRQTIPPKVIEERQVSNRIRVNLKMTDIMPPNAPPPSSSVNQARAAGPLALATEGEGPGDAFNLAGNPGGNSLTGGGFLGEGGGSGIGGGYDPNARYGWYYNQVAGRIEEALRKKKKLQLASTRLEIKVWTDESARISRVQLVNSSGDDQLDKAVKSVVGLKLSEPLPDDVPMPFILRLTARRPS